MTNGNLLELVNAGVLGITNHTLSAAHGYKVYKFKKSISNAFKALQEDEKDILTCAGIGDVAAFDARRNELVTKHDEGNATEQDTKELNEFNDKAQRFFELREQLYNEEVAIDCKTIPYEEWKKLQDENYKEKDVLVGNVELLLEGVLWSASDED